MITPSGFARTTGLICILAGAAPACDTTDTAVTDPGPTGTETPEADPAGDTRPPSLIFADFFPKRVDVSREGALVEIFAELEDDGTGVELVFAQFTGPKKPQFDQFAELQRVEGDRRLGTYEGSIFIPPNADVGAWTLLFIRADDQAGNKATYDTDALEEMGIPVSLLVSS